MNLAYALRQAEDGSLAVCVLVGSRLSEARLQNELEQFRDVIHPSIARRIHFLLDRGDPRDGAVAFRGTLENERPDF
jgi:hypothetical protein